MSLINVKFFGRLYQLIRNISAIPHITIKDYCSKDCIHVFHHIPKSAGSSFTKLINSRFMLIRETYYLKGFYKSDRINTKRARNAHCITGHFEYPGYQIPDRYPEFFGPNFRLITFIRDPLETQISLYYYKNPRIKKNVRLVDSIFFEKNYISKRIPCNEDNYREILDKYFFIGITERFEESVELLMRLLNKKNVRIPKKNVSKKDNQVLELSNETIKKFTKENDLDYLVYNYCKKKFEKHKSIHQ